MAKDLELSTEQSQGLEALGRALSSKHRIDILKLLYYQSLNINEISEALSLPSSSTAMHVRVLEEADLINTENQPGTRGTMKLCSRKVDNVFLKLSGNNVNVGSITSISMPVGHFTRCQVSPTCGMAGEKNYLITEDSPRLFFSPDRIQSQLIWTSSGYFEYCFPKPPLSKGAFSNITFTAEICSEAPNYRENWKSDITFWINGIDCGTWQCPGDFGERRGRLNPSWWKNGNTQYGLLTKFAVNHKGTFVNEIKVSDVSLSQIPVLENDFISLTLGNKADAEFVGGLNLFGQGFGDYDQDIVMMIEHGLNP